MQALAIGEAGRYRARPLGGEGKTVPAIAAAAVATEAVTIVLVWTIMKRSANSKTRRSEEDVEGVWW